jgi:hypothetical protein
MPLFATTPSLSAIPGWAVLVTVALVIILSGVVIIVGRYQLENKKATSRSVQGPGQPSEADGTLVRSWIAIALVSGLLVFCAVALSLRDSQLQSTLFGGLVASVGAAVAFYFSTKSAEQARQDVMNASQTTTDVPNLHGLKVSDAQAELARTPLQLVLEQPSALLDDVVASQSPAAGTALGAGSKVSIATHAPVAAQPHQA